MSTPCRIQLGLLLFLALFSFSDLQAQWALNGVPLDDSPQYHYDPQIVSDRAGGAIIAWIQDDTGLMAQRIDALGVNQWADGGIDLPDVGFDLQMIEDRAGGAVICGAGGHVYAVWVSASGALTWATEWPALWPSGVIDFGGVEAADPQIAYSGGAIIIVFADRPGADSNIYANVVTNLGEYSWYGPEADDICRAAGDQENPQIIEDGVGGVIIVWEDAGIDTQASVYGVRITLSSGVNEWDGYVAICTATEAQHNPQMISDGAGGAFIAWDDERGDGDIYAQHVNSAGNLQWAPGGLPVCSAVGRQSHVTLSPDGHGGVLLAWEDRRTGEGSDIYAQRISPEGTPLWDVDGVAFSTSVDFQQSPTIAAVDSDGVVVAWSSPYEFRDIYAQKSDMSGNLLWQANGVAISTADGVQYDQQLVADYEGGAIIVWTTQGETGGIYAQRVHSDGGIVACELQRHSARVDGQCVSVEWSLSELQEGAAFVVSRSSGPRSGPIDLSDQVVRLDRLTYQCRDASVEVGGSYRYTVGIVEAGQTRILFETDAVEVPDAAFGFQPSFPNPFNPTTSISFSLSNPGHVTLSVYDLTGRLVKTLVDSPMSAGAKTAEWNGTDRYSEAVASGTYILRLETDQRISSQKVMLAK